MLPSRIARYLVPGYRLLQRAALAVLRLRAEPDVTVSSISVEAGRDDAGVKLRVSYHLNALSRSSGRFLIFDAAGVALEITDFESSPFSTSTVKRGAGLEPFVIVFFPEGQVLQGATITLTFLWRAGTEAALPSSPACLVVPSSLPRLVGPRDVTGSIDSPKVAAKVETRVAVGRVSAQSRTSESHTHALELSLVLDPADSPMDLGELGTIRFAGPEYQSLSDTHRETIQRLVTEILRELSQIHGVVPNVDLVLCPPAFERGGRLEPFGSLVPLSIRDFGIGHQAVRPSYFALAQRLSGVWWGTGCRITGSRGLWWTATLRMVGALLVCQQLDGEDRFRRQEAHLEELASRSRAQELWAALLGGVQIRDTARQALRLFELLSQSPDRLEVWRVWMRSAWGHEVSSDVIEKFLQEEIV